MLAFPVMVVVEGGKALIQGSPGGRRALLDWVLFHVEPEAGVFLSRYRRALAQRNSALRGKDFGTAKAWEDELAVSGAQWEQQRMGLVRRLAAELCSSAHEFELQWQPDIRYSPGAFTAGELRASLAVVRGKDERLGYTSVGPHATDLRIRDDSGADVRATKSQGEIKRLSILILLAAHRLVAETGRAPLLLIDDLPAELDAAGQKKVLEILFRMNADALITGIEPLDSRRVPEQGSIPLFHVEHGQIRPVV